MADNIQAGTQTGSGPILASDQRSSDSVHFPKGKVVFGADDTFTDVSMLNGLPVQPATSTAWVLGAGAAVIGAVTQSGTWVVSLPAGAATAAKQPALGTAGTASTDVITVQGIASGVAQPISNAALTSIIADYNADAAIHVLVTGTVNPGNTANTTPWLISDRPATSGGLTPYTLLSAASNNATSVKASAGQLYSVQAFNNSTNVAYLKFYDKASAPTPASDTVKLAYMIPASGGFTIEINKGLAFATGIAFAVVGAASFTDNTSVAAGAFLINCGYK